jgi:hypothetical protein
LVPGDLVDGLKIPRNNGVTATDDNDDVPGKIPENPY